MTDKENYPPLRYVSEEDFNPVEITSKPTDKEIIKALECCMDEMGCKKGCPCFDPNSKSSHCTAVGDNGLEKLALDLINRQQATIETLRKCVEQHHIIRKDGKSPLSLLTAEIRAEAIKEFAERLKDYGTLPDLPWDIWKTFADGIDNLVKEMVGEQDV